MKSIDHQKKSFRATHVLLPCQFYPQGLFLHIQEASVGIVWFLKDGEWILWRNYAALESMQDRGFVKKLADVGEGIYK